MWENDFKQLLGFTWRHGGHVGVLLTKEFWLFLLSGTPTWPLWVLSFVSLGIVWNPRIGSSTIYKLRGGSIRFILPRPNTEMALKKNSYSGARIWNRDIESLESFKKQTNFCHSAWKQVIVFFPYVNLGIINTFMLFIYLIMIVSFSVVNNVIIHFSW